MRAGLVWFISTVVIMGVFLAFVGSGWPGEPDGCIYDNPHTCFCEGFDVADVESGKKGVRQPVNTWFNVYSIITAAIVAAYLSKDRRTFAGRAAPNLMRSDSWIADIYIFAVLFLGLGSMWFHASLKDWGGTFDGLSMYVYASFLVYYTAVRLFGNKMIFWVGYPFTVFFFAFLHCMFSPALPSFVLIGILVVAYLVFEFWIWIKRGEFALGRALPIVLWLLAVVSILAATAFWATSQTPGEMLCNPTSPFQPHGLLWHPLAGLMAVLLYFYWREEE